MPAIPVTGRWAVVPAGMIIALVALISITALGLRAPTLVTKTESPKRLVPTLE